MQIMNYEIIKKHPSSAEISKGVIFVYTKNV